MTKFRGSRGFAVPDFLILGLILAAVCAVWYFAWCWIDVNIQGTSNAETANQARGLFGDKFGAINSLFSGFAFAAIIFTIVLQNRELNETRLAMRDQSKTASSQRFDTTFFQLLSLHNDITAKLSDLQHSGRNSFTAFHERIIRSDSDFPAFCALNKLEREDIRVLKDNRAQNNYKVPEQYKARLDDADISNIEALLEKGVGFCDTYLDETMSMHERKIRVAYEAAATVHLDKYSHYFRNLYHILKFIKESNLIEGIEKPRYAKIVRSQLSEVELVALFYNSLTEVRLPGRDYMELGYPKMGKLLTEFDILQNMSPRSVIHRSHIAIFNANNKAQK